MEAVSFLLRLFFIILCSGEVIGFPNSLSEDHVTLNSTVVHEYSEEEKTKSPEENKILNRNARQILSNKRRIWKKGIVPYVFDSRFCGEMKNLIRSAMEEFQEHTCIRFIERTNEIKYLNITNDNDGCHSSVGRRRVVSTSNLDENSCMNKGIIMHELMHVLGFIHEHERPDRDDHITIIRKNIKDRKKYGVNFSKYRSDRVRISSSYALDTIMHYGPNEFSKDKNLPVIVPKGNRKITTDVYKTKTLPVVDIIRIIYFYGC